MLWSDLGLWITSIHWSHIWATPARMDSQRRRKWLYCRNAKRDSVTALVTAFPMKLISLSRLTSQSRSGDIEEG